MTAVPTWSSASSPQFSAAGPDMAAIPMTGGSGLKVPSLVRFDRLACSTALVIAGKIGAAPADWLHAHRAVFFGVFGFGQP